ncbi:MAG: hypothetical protein ACK4YQ_05325 [Phenylobacterium sp.]|uniref:hypothetical protein n=1 Tax=Phenylobacterium sp. TaxID=1871053 RepID=UPI00391902EE
MSRSAALALAVLASASPATAGPEPWGGWIRLDLAAAGRALVAASPKESGAGQVLTVVIEGDGAAHDRRGRPTADPTPRRAASLEIARAWPGGPRAWLGRLCQYGARADPACTPADWTTGRFSPTAVAAADAAIDQLKARAGAAQVLLVGWSGGGVMAVLVAARRDDVAGLVTLAAPLDLGGWTARQGLTGLADSLDPAGLPPMPQIPQAHVFGSFDTTVPPDPAKAVAHRLAGPAGRVVVWPERHACCWARRVDELAALLKAAGSDPALAGRQPAQETAAAP